jgi:hypothetical protein
VSTVNDKIPAISVRVEATSGTDVQVDGKPLALDASGKGDSKISAAVVGKMKEVVLQGFGRKEEMESDEKGLALANKAGYAPAGLGGFLQKLADRNKTSTEKRGLFASHPEMNDRIKKLGEMAAKMNSTATLEARYKKFISYPPPKAITEIAVVADGSAGLAGGGGGSNGGAKKAEANAADKKEESKQADSGEQPKKKGFGLSKLSNFGGGDKKQAQVTGSGGGRGLDPEVDAKGGGNPTLVAVKVTASDVEAFKKEGKLS